MGLGGTLAPYPATAAENAAAVTPINGSLPAGQVDRYFINTIPGTTAADAGFTAAIAQAQQTGGAPITVNSLLAIANNLTIPAGVSMQVFSGNINIASGKTLTVNGNFFAQRITCFTGPGLVAFNQGSVIDTYPEWWGARSDATLTGTGTDSTTAMQACINASAGQISVGLVNIRLASGYYLVGALTMPPATTIRGSSREDCGFIAKTGTTGTWITDTGSASKIILDELAMYAQSAYCPGITNALKLGYGGTQHGTEGYLRCLWVRDCACSGGGWHIDINGNVAYYDLISVYGPNSQSITAITLATSAVITISTVSAVNPFSVNAIVQVLAATGMTQINGVSGTITATGGVSGAWTITVNINSSAFSAYTGSGLLYFQAANLVRIAGSPNFCSKVITVAAGADSYSAYFNGAGTVVHGIEIEAPTTCKTGFAPLSMQADTYVHGCTIALPNSTVTSFDHLIETSASCTSWCLEGLELFNSGGFATVSGGNIKLLGPGTYMGNTLAAVAGNQTGTGSYIFPSLGGPFKITAPNSGNNNPTLTVTEIAGSAAACAQFETNNSSGGGYIQIQDIANSATRGYFGHGSAILSGAAIGDFLFRSEGGYYIASGGNNKRVYVDSNGRISITVPSAAGAALTFPAGTATIEPLLLTAGTNLTTTAAGVLEYDGTCQYFTPFATNRSIVMTEAVQCISAAYTLTSQTAAQKLLNATTNGAITLPVGVYEFECDFTLTSMSASSGAFGFALGGTSTHTDAWWAHADKLVTLATAAATAFTSFNTAANVAISPSNTSTAGWAQIRGIIRVTVTGTIIPQVSLGVAAAAIVGANSFFRILPVGPSGFTTVGQWT